MPVLQPLAGLVILPKVGIEDFIQFAQSAQVRAKVLRPK